MGKIKICGITNATDALLAAKLGADALGFNFYPESPRYVVQERVRAIVASLPPLVTPVGVFVDEEAEVIREVCRFCGIHTVQLHGAEPPEIVAKLRSFKVIKAFQVESQRDLASLRRYDADAFLLDAWAPDKKGGTGHTFNWEMAKSVALHHRIILAGGLNPSNISEAIRHVMPYAVDACSGVEAEPGKKDRKLMREFIREAGKAFLNALA